MPKNNDPDHILEEVLNSLEGMAEIYVSVVSIELRK
jgi:hypothetical protein